MALDADTLFAIMIPIAVLLAFWGVSDKEDRR